MALSSDLTSLFVKTTKDSKETKTESTVYGTVVRQDNKTWVQLDGSDLLTPFTATADVKDGERVLVTIKNHTATVTGNTSAPAGRHTDIVEVQNTISEFDTVYAKQAYIDEAYITKAEIEEAYIDKATIEEAYIDKAEIEKLYASKGYIEEAYIDKAEIEKLYATKGEIDTLNTKYADIKFANIDFAKIDKATFGEFYAASGIIQDYVSENGTVTGKLVAVSINADNITAGSLLAERIMLQGDDGLFYKLNVDAMGKATAETLPDDEQEQLKNGIHGKSIIAESITADKISVSDLVAFGATIGGLKIEDGSIHSFVKGSDENGKNDVHNTTAGIYLDSEGQMNIGDQNSYIKYYEDEAGKRKLEIAADEVTIGGSSAATPTDIKAQINKIKVGAKNLIRHSETLSFEDYYFSGGVLFEYTADSKNGKFVRGISAMSDDSGNVTITTPLPETSITNDGNGNIAITIS